MFKIPSIMKNRPRSGAFQPQLHFTGRATPTEVSGINQLLAEYGKYIVGHRLCEPVRGTYALELQFDASPEGDAALSACQTGYEAFISTSVTTKLGVLV